MNRHEEDDMNNNNVQQPAGPSDSDYCTDAESPYADSDAEMRQPAGDVNDALPHVDEWIEMDIPAEFSHSLGFLSDSDFQAVLQSFSEFTSQQLRTVNCTAVELRGMLRNHLAYLLWRRAVLVKLRQLPPVNLETGQLDSYLDAKWHEESELMTQNRHRFCSLADATTVPQLVLSTIKSYCIKRQADDQISRSIRATKRFRRN